MHTTVVCMEMFFRCCKGAHDHIDVQDVR